jgi:hypothetical protein
MPFRLVSPGAILFAFGWSIATYVFGFYVANFGSYNATYGALGAVVVLLIWLYLSSFLLVAGAELNSVLAKHLEENARKAESRQRKQNHRSPAAEQPPRNQPAVMRLIPWLVGASLALIGVAGLKRRGGRDASAAGSG